MTDILSTPLQLIRQIRPACDHFNRLVLRLGCNFSIKIQSVNMRDYISLPLSTKKTLFSRNHRFYKPLQSQSDTIKKLPISQQVRIPRDNLEQELLRCQKQAIPGPHETFFCPEIQRRIVETGEGKQRNALEIICVGIASPESLATLQLSLRYYRAGERSNVPAPALALSTKDRFSVIEGVGKEIAYMNLLRRCHIVKLYEDHREVHPGFDDGFFLITQQTAAVQGRQSAGNPKNKAESRITKLILEQTYPNLVQDSPEYNAKYRIINHVRKLGKRLHMLKTRFGDGILGLIQCAEYGLGIEFPLEITDTIILAPRDSAFEDFIALLDQSQGDNLRQFSDAISPIIESVLLGTVHGMAPFPIENVEQGKILDLPKGSRTLLHLISHQT